MDGGMVGMCEISLGAMSRSGFACIASLAASSARCSDGLC